jgi:hypothetical protein
LVVHVKNITPDEVNIEVSWTPPGALVTNPGVPCLPAPQVDGGVLVGDWDFSCGWFFGLGPPWGWHIDQTQTKFTKLLEFRRDSEKNFTFNMAYGNVYPILLAKEPTAPNYKTTCIISLNGPNVIVDPNQPFLNTRNDTNTRQADVQAAQPFVGVGGNDPGNPGALWWTECAGFAPYKPYHYFVQIDFQLNNIAKVSFAPYAYKNGNLTKGSGLGPTVTYSGSTGYVSGTAEGTDNGDGIAKLAIYVGYPRAEEGGR